MIKIKRKVDEIIVHASATPTTFDVSRENLYQWHVVENGWSDIGYHYLIRRNGEIVDCRPVEKIGSHCKGKNRYTIGICLAGPGGDPSLYTDEQYKALEWLIKSLSFSNNITKVSQHSDYDKKKPFCAGLNSNQIEIYNSWLVSQQNQTAKK